MANTNKQTEKVSEKELWPLTMTFLIAVLLEVRDLDVISNNPTLVTPASKAAARQVNGTIEALVSTRLEQLGEAWDGEGHQDKWAEEVEDAERVSSALQYLASRSGSLMPHS